ncbi:MAG: response regulator [bacterium]
MQSREPWWSDVGPLEATRRPAPGLLVLRDDGPVTLHVDGVAFGWPSSAAWFEAVAAAIELPPRVTTSCMLRTPTGEQRWFRLTPKGERGGPVMVIVEDLSPPAEPASTAEPLAQVLAALDDAIVVAGPQSEVVLINPACCELFGLDRDPSELIGGPARAVGAAIAEWFADPAGYLDRAERIVWAGELVRDEMAETVDGRVIACSFVPIRSGRRALGHAWVFRNMTAEARAMRAVREREAWLAAVIEGAPGPVWTCDDQRRLVLHNQHFARSFEYVMGWRPVAGMSLMNVQGSAAQLGWWRTIYDRTLAGEAVYATLDESVPGWAGLTFDVSTYPVVDGERLSGATVYMRDVTAARRASLRQRRLNLVLDTLTRAQARFIDQHDRRGSLAELLDAFVGLTGSTYGLLAQASLPEPGGAAPDPLRPAAIVEAPQPGEVLTARDGAGAIEHRRLEAAVLAARSAGEALLVGGALAAAVDALDPDHPPLTTPIGLPFVSGDRLLGLIVLAGRPGGYDAAALADLPPLLNCCAGLISAQHDEERRQRAEEALKLAKESAEAADRAKGDFLASMSHEIRTPLNAVIGLTELALDAAVTDDQRALLRAAAANSETLLRLISDILDFSRIEAGIVDLDAAPFELRRLVEDVVELMAVRADEKGIELVADIEPVLPAPLVGDAHRLRQVVTNLVSNAVKFTDDGAVVVEVRAAPQGERVAVHLAVRDTGCGIPAAEQEQVFARFHRVASTAARGEGGTGLGLAIVRTLVTAMGGTITLTSTPGAGSVFTVELALPRADDTVEDGFDPSALAGLRVLLAHPPGPTTRWIAATLEALGARVLVAHDLRGAARVLVEGPIDVALTAFALPEPLPAPRVRLVPVTDLDRAAGGPRLTLPARRDALVKVVLDAVGRRRGRARGPEREPAAHGAEARALIRGEVYDLVLMDLHMPRLDGFEAVRRLRAEEARARVTRTPVIAVTAHATEAVRQRCVADGFDGFIAKPATGALLNAAIARHARDEPIALVVDDAADSRRLLVRYLRRHTPLRVRQAASAEEAREVAIACLPALVLIDAVLPGASGFDLARELRAALGPDAVLVMVTGRTGAEPRRLAAAAGCDGFVTKPVRRVELLSTIEAHLPFDIARADEPPIARVDPDLLDLIPAFLADRRVDIERIDAALAAGDFTVIERLGHSMRGTGGAYGMTEVSRLGAALEAAAAAADAAGCRALRDALAVHVERVRVVGEDEG